jgi:hypothetical protein
MFPLKENDFPRLAVPQSWSTLIKNVFVRPVTLRLHLSMDLPCFSGSVILSFDLMGYQNKNQTYVVMLVS